VRYRKNGSNTVVNVHSLCLKEMEQTIAEDQKTYGGATAKSKATTAPSSVTSTAKELHAGTKRTYIDAGLHEESITEAQRSVTDPATLQSLMDLRDIITGMEI